VGGARSGVGSSAEARRSLIRAIESAGESGWHLQTDRRTNANVMRVFEVVHFERLIPGYDSARA
jgi:hypothetical protein